MPADLFEPLREAKRARLVALEWERLLGEGALWQAPDGGIFTEKEAFLWLARHEAGQGKSGD